MLLKLVVAIVITSTAVTTVMLYNKYHRYHTEQKQVKCNGPLSIANLFSQIKLKYTEFVIL